MTTPSPEDVFALIHKEKGAVWLDGGDANETWSILAFNPTEIVQVGNDWPHVGRRLTGKGGEASAPFTGGCIGYIGYGAGHYVSPVPEQGSTWEPEVWLAHYEGGLCYHHESRSWQIHGAPSFCRRGRDLLNSAQPLPAPTRTKESIAPTTTSPEGFLAAVQDILDLLHEGDCYQINLTRPVHLRQAGDPWQAYRRLRSRSAPEFGAFLRLSSDTAILSNSPEQFLAVEGNQITSTPIKGTRPRGHDLHSDRRLMQELFTSPKDHAELTMIVDLIRNDVSRVAIAGSVHTSERRITSHANVHHASQVVRGQLRPDNDTWSALQATFPPGSVTGAPKIRACTRIAELESEPRGVYCGAIGFASNSGRSHWSVAIRTAVWHQGNCRYHVGGGVVVDSDPMDEWWETVHKGTEMAIAFGAGPEPIPKAWIP